ncbi:MAG: hypothetical protein JW951_08915 [Lentisphaerae bacterium]|nr:hypothetical protein [Lentisphaerota bacterium]
MKTWAWVLLVIAAVEAVLHVVLPSRSFNHEVDRLLYAIRSGRMNAPVVILGDSVARGIFENADLPPDRYAVAACNQAVETAGQYFLLRRILERHPGRPRAVIFCAIDPRAGDLRQPLTENYVQRCFTRWREIGACLRGTRDPAFGLKMAAYKLLASFRYRIHLQRRLAGVDDRAILTAAGRPAGAAGRAADAAHGLFARLNASLRHRRGERLSPRYLRRMAALLEARGIPLLILPAPTTPEQAAHCRRVMDKLRPLEDAYGNVTVLRELYRAYPPDHFADGWHLNARGLARHRPVIGQALQRADGEL